MQFLGWVIKATSQTNSRSTKTEKLRNELTVNMICFAVLYTKGAKDLLIRCVVSNLWVPIKYTAVNVWRVHELRGTVFLFKILCTVIRIVQIKTKWTDQAAKIRKRLSVTFYVTLLLHAPRMGKKLFLLWSALTVSVDHTTSCLTFWRRIFFFKF